MESDLVRKSEAFAKEVFSQPIFDRYPYHNLTHTLEVVEAVSLIGKETMLTDSEMEAAVVAAWFHDLGYLAGPEGHEMESEKLARTNLSAWGVAPGQVEEVALAITATRRPQQPTSLIARVLCDADLYHLSTEKCLTHTELLYQEMGLLGAHIPKKQWLKSTLDFLKEHQYHTPYGKGALQAGKKQNIKAIKQRLGQEGKTSKSSSGRSTSREASAVIELVEVILRKDRRASLLLLAAILVVATSVTSLLYLGWESSSTVALLALTTFGTLTSISCLRGMRDMPDLNTESGTLIAKLMRARSARKKLKKLVKAQAQPEWLDTRVLELKGLVVRKTWYQKQSVRLLLIGLILGAVIWLISR